MLKGEIISVGTELLLGQITNTNSQYISKRMSEIGCSLYFQVNVGDNPERLTEVILQAQRRSNLIIFIGGLGPTMDDITKEVFSKIIKRNLVLDKYTYEKLLKYFHQRNIEMTGNNIKQAMIIEGSTVLPNDFGLAVGIRIKVGSIHYVFLPGPPSEMKPMVDNYLVPWLKTLNISSTFFSTVMRFAGINESAVEEKIIDIIRKQKNPTIASLVDEGEVLIRLTAKTENEQEALKIIKPIEIEIDKRLKEYHFGNGNERLELKVIKLLKTSNLTISVSESCTGGLVGESITRYSGSSSVYSGGVICYNNEIKNKILNVPLPTLASKGSVSPDVAIILAENTLKLFNTDFGVSITGIAGPTTIEDKPIGLIYIAIAEKGRNTEVYEINLAGNRRTIQNNAAKYVYYYLWCKLYKNFTNNY
ncbi:MAG: competence/damage-inducible protein A [Vulcanibacillus sp.]